MNHVDLKKKIKKKKINDNHIYSTFPFNLKCQLRFQAFHSNQQIPIYSFPW